MSTRYRLTEAADEDIVDILAESGRSFGPRQRERYALLIKKAVEWVAEESGRPGSYSREDVFPGVRSFHMEIAARRRGAASHIVYYAQGDMADGCRGIVILRILHERMDPTLHLSEHDDACE